MLSIEASRRITNFKPIRLDFGPFAGLQRIIQDSDNEQDQFNFRALEDFLNSVEFLNILRYYILSDEFDDDFRDRIEMYLNFDRTYYVIDKELIYNSLNNLNDINNIIPFHDRLELLKQREYFNFGQSSINYDLLQEDFNIYDYLSLGEVEKLLNKQSTFYNRIPNYQDLTDNGTIQKIFNEIDNRNLVSENNLIEIVNSIITSRLTDNVYLTYKQIEDIYKNPLNINTVLSNNEYILLLNRNMSKLSFIKESEIENIKDNIYPEYSEDEIKLILQSEQNLITLSNQMLTPNDIENIIVNYLKNIETGTGTTTCCEEISDLDVQQWIQEVILIN